MPPKPSPGCASTITKTIILVTNNYHMARSLLELQRLDPRLTIAPYPVVNSDLSNGKWMMQPEVVRVLLAEYMKYLGAVSRRVLPVPILARIDDRYLTRTAGSRRRQLRISLRVQCIERWATE